MLLFFEALQNYIRHTRNTKSVIKILSGTWSRLRNRVSCQPG